MVPSLVDELVDQLTDTTDDALVQAAMAHLNLVMIHPFRDGNGRLAHALQTLVLARRGMADPTFSSIEEWLGANTADYYRVLAHTGAGAWHPDRDAALWVSFNLRAHHMQAQTLQQRIDQAMAMWTAIDALSADHGLPDRAGLALYEAALGYRVRRATYLKRAEVEERTASRDLKHLVELELLRPVGATKGRHYVPGPALTSSRTREGRRGDRFETPTRGCQPDWRNRPRPTTAVHRRHPSVPWAPRDATGERGSLRGPGATQERDARGTRSTQRSPMSTGEQRPGGCRAVAHAAQRPRRSRRSSRRSPRRSTP